jgi:tetratricopeptide (TPR) repeat protein
LEQLAERYQALYDTAEPASLLTSVAAHVRMAQDTLRHDPSPVERRRLLRNLAEVILAGHLAADDLGNTMSGRAYYGLALDAAREVTDDQLTAIAHGHAAQLAAAEGLTMAALDHLTAGNEHVRPTPAIACWLGTIEATIHADRGEHTPARDALDRAHTILDQAGGWAASASYRHPGTPLLNAATGHVLSLAGAYIEACKKLLAALDQSHPIPRRQRVLILIDLATAELHSGDLPAACSHATQAADLLHHAAYAVGAARLCAFRTAAQRPLNDRALRALDERLTRHAA